MSQITRCPSCTTLFKVVPDQLRISEGWVRCGHCQHVFDATLHLQAAPLPTSPAPAVSAPPTTPDPAVVTAQPAALPVASAAAVAAAASADPWEIPLPPPPTPPTPEEVAAAAPEVLDFAAPELALELDMPTASSPAPVSLPSDGAAATPTSPDGLDGLDGRASVELDWPEAVPPAPAAAPVLPLVAPPPEPTPAPVAPAPIPAASIPTDIDWPEPALEPEPDPGISSGLGSTELAHGSSTDAPTEPVMPELDLAPDLAPLPPPSEGMESILTAAPLAPAPSLDDGRIEPSWSAAPPARQAVSPPLPEELAPPAPAASIPLAAAPLAATTAAATVATAAVTAVPDAPESPRTERNPEEPSFVRAARRQALWRKPAVRIGLALLALLLLVALMGQIVLHDRHRLAAAHPSWRPMLELLCTPLDCTVQPYRHISSVVVESSTFNRVDGGVYHFAVTLKNRSDLALEMPAVELTLTDANEQPVLRRVFTPEELGAGHTLAAHAESSTTVLVRIAATGNAPMAGYRVLAFYP